MRKWLISKIFVNYTQLRQFTQFLMNNQIWNFGISQLICVNIPILEILIGSMKLCMTKNQSFPSGKYRFFDTIERWYKSNYGYPVCPVWRPSLWNIVYKKAFLYLLNCACKKLQIFQIKSRTNIYQFNWRTNESERGQNKRQDTKSIDFWTQQSVFSLSY